MQTEPDNKPPKLVVTTQGFPLGVDCTLNGLSVCGAKHTCRQCRRPSRSLCAMPTHWPLVVALAPTHTPTASATGATMCVDGRAGAEHLSNCHYAYLRIAPGWAGCRGLPLIR
jgi:hypothetical protein